jgi:hypothetical protein
MIFLGWINKVCHVHRLRLTGHCRGISTIRPIQITFLLGVVTGRATWTPNVANANITRFTGTSLHAVSEATSLCGADLVCWFIGCNSADLAFYLEVVAVFCGVDLAIRNRTDRDTCVTYDTVSTLPWGKI